MPSFPATSPKAPAQRDTVELSTVRRIALVMYAGAIFGLVCAVVGPDPQPEDHRGLLITAGLEVVALAMLALRPLTMGLLRASSYYGVATTCLCVAVARPTNGVPLYTIWPVLLAAYGLPRRDFLLLLGAALAGLGVAIGG